MRVGHRKKCQQSTSKVECQDITILHVVEQT